MKSSMFGAAAAAILFSAAPASAQHWSDPNFIAAANVQVHRGGPAQSFANGSHMGFPDWQRRSGPDRPRHHRGDGFGGVWGYYEADVNRSWEADSFNDWWHDRPDRAFPRWVKTNGGCAPDRMWWSGSGWRC